MRVITGKYKGRKLVAPKSDARPTLDRMKETLFNILDSRLRNALILDLFAGSGQLAIECLSRGAKKAVLCDNNKQALEAIKANFSKIGETPCVVLGDFRDCLMRTEERFDVIFVDPPYKSGFYREVLESVSARGLLSEDGVVVCERAADELLPDTVGDLVCFDRRKMGAVGFDFYKRGEKCE